MPSSRQGSALRPAPPVSSPPVPRVADGSRHPSRACAARGDGVARAFAARPVVEGRVQADRVLHGHAELLHQPIGLGQQLPKVIAYLSVTLASPGSRSRAAALVRAGMLRWPDSCKHGAVVGQLPRAGSRAERRVGRSPPRGAGRLFGRASTSSVTPVWLRSSIPSPRNVDRGAVMRRPSNGCSSRCRASGTKGPRGCVALLDLDPREVTPPGREVRRPTRPEARIPAPRPSGPPTRRRVRST